MALNKPIAFAKSAFDSKNEEMFTFSSSGGDQVVKNRLTIRRNDTNQIIYQKTIESFQFLQNLPKLTLTNGVYYNYYFNTYNTNGDISPDSNIVAFYCYTTPVINFINIPSDNTIKNSTFAFQVLYNQQEKELIDFIKINLYSGSGILIESSNNIYSLNQPPITLEYTFNGLLDKATYFVEAVGTTINNTIISTDRKEFSVNYIKKEVFSKIDIFPNCNEGYVQFVSNIVVVDGISNPSPPIYIDKTYIDLSDKDSYVKWIEGYEIPSDFEMTLWFKPNWLGEVCNLLNDNASNNKFALKLNRYIPYGETKDKDCIELYGYEKGELKVFQVSNYIDALNNKSDMELWLRKIGNSYDIKIKVLNKVESMLEWNGNSNVDIDKLNNIFYKDNLKVIESPVVEIDNSIGPIFPLTETKLINGIYDNIDITRNIIKEPSLEFPVWDYDTSLNCFFNETINAGNVNILLSQISSFKVKRRKYGEFKWITIYQKPIKTQEDLYIVTTDYAIPEGRFEWALVPVSSGNIEGNYILTDSEIAWNGTFISTSASTFKLYNGVSYQSFTSNQLVGILQPIGSKYPITIKNSDVDYVNGTISGNLYGYNFEKTHIIDRKDVVRQAEDFKTMLNSGMTLTIKDWNGNIWIGNVASSPVITYDSNYGNGITNVSFSFVEQGKYDNQEDLYYNGIVDILE